MKKLNDTIKMISMTVLAIAIYVIILNISNSACAIFFCQPKEPSKIAYSPLKVKAR